MPSSVQRTRHLSLLSPNTDAQPPPQKTSLPWSVGSACSTRSSPAAIEYRHWLEVPAGTEHGSWGVGGSKKMMLPPPAAPMLSRLRNQVWWSCGVTGADVVDRAVSCPKWLIPYTAKV